MVCEFRVPRQTHRIALQQSKVKLIISTVQAEGTSVSQVQVRCHIHAKDSERQTAINEAVLKRRQVDDKHVTDDEY